MELLKSLDTNEGLNEVHKKMRDLGYRGRITKKAIEVIIISYLLGWTKRCWLHTTTTSFAEKRPI